MSSKINKVPWKERGLYNHLICHKVSIVMIVYKGPGLYTGHILSSCYCFIMFDFRWINILKKGVEVSTTSVGISVEFNKGTVSQTLCHSTTISSCSCKQKTFWNIPKRNDSSCIIITSYKVANDILIMTGFE